ncbi:TolB-like protein [Novosphingobium kunmingense]|uniref:TolB-like protein n=1 Tax=Novosphingobium kunmingense TaxID=1211806 RepID=A0A2N0H667_9SPHN|nr:TIR domain-containing protein [Novosphingobium kunmingense]PKB14426.1 TolB-like protein [Novosphingobium kunmingense]
MSVPDIFISYNREDAAFAQAYADAFTDAGFEVWWDATLRSGEDYDAVTEDALRKSKAVVVLWSPRSVNSRWVRAEATIADRGQRLMPVMIEDCERPVMFELKQTTDMSGWCGDTTDPKWTAFIADVARRIGKESSAAPRQTRPAATSAPVAAAPGPIAEPAAPADDRAGVAVLPFTCRAGDPELEIEAEDLTEDLTRELAYNRFIRVIAAGTMAPWRNKSVEHKAIGRQVDARYLVEGKLQSSGAGTRLTVQLVDGISGNVLWSGRMNASPDEVDTSHDALPVAVALQLAEQIVAREESHALARKAPYSPTDRILRASALARRDDEKSILAAIDEARAAVEGAPDSGLAQAILASALAALAESRGTTPDAEQIREIQATTRQAMRLDGNNPTVLMALAGAYQGLGEYEICLRLARRTVDLWPVSPTSHRILGDSYRMLGRTAEAVEAYRRQDRLSPYDSSRYVALTNLGLSLLLEGEGQEAEAAIDQALMLNPEYPLALEWKAIVAEHLGKHAAALAAVRQLRAAEGSAPLNRHIWQLERYDALRERTAPHAATLMRLWEEAGGKVPVKPRSEMPPASEPLRAAPPPVEKVAPAVAAAAAIDVIDVDTPEFPVEDVVPVEAAEADGLMLAAEPEKIAPEPLVAARTEAFAPAAKPAAEKAPARRSVLPRVAALVGVVALAGGGAYAMLGGQGGAPLKDTPGFAVAKAPEGSPAAVAAAAAVPAATVAGQSVDSQKIGQALTSLIAASRNARRPAGEIAALEAGQQSLVPLLTQLQANPADAAAVTQLRDLAVGLVRPQGAALTADANRWIADQERTAAAANRQLSAEGAASVDRALNRARGPRAELAAAVNGAAQAPDAAAAFAAGQKALGAYGRVRAVSVAAAIAGAKTAVAAAAADTAKAQNRLSLMRAQLGSIRSEVAQMSSQAVGMTQVEKPGLFASGAKRQSHKLRKDNADRVRALLTEADSILTASHGITDPSMLTSSVSRMQGLRSQAAGLIASSSAALKTAASSPDDKASASPKK